MEIETVWIMTTMSNSSLQQNEIEVKNDVRKEKEEIRKRR